MWDDGTASIARVQLQLVDLLGTGKNCIAMAKRFLVVHFYNFNCDFLVLYAKKSTIK